MLWSHIARDPRLTGAPDPSAVPPSESALSARVLLAHRLSYILESFPDTEAGLRWAVRTINFVYDAQFWAVEETSVEH